jgi:uncharacterized protein
VRIDASRIPQDGLLLSEELSPTALGLETELIRFGVPLKVRAAVTKITNALTVSLDLHSLAILRCSRCLKEYEIELKKNFELNFAIEPKEMLVELDPLIRDEVILEYDIKQLCRPDCRGLCVKCGKDLNLGECSCTNKDR